MKRTLITLVFGTTVAIGAFASPTAVDARWHRGFPVAPIVGGLAADWRREPFLAQRLRHQEPLCTNPSIMGRHAWFGASASGTAGAGTFAA